jgi:small redox-active disulfide protein 2
MMEWWNDGEKRGMERRNINRGYMKLTVWQDALAFYAHTVSVFRNWPYEMKRGAIQQEAGGTEREYSTHHSTIPLFHCSRLPRERGFGMTKIQILGTGCPKCRKLAENAKAAVKEAGIECDVVKVTDINEIMKFGVMMTPALAIDGQVKTVGKVPSSEEIKKMLA